jgi:hypothetical protein
VNNGLGKLIPLSPALARVAEKRQMNGQAKSVLRLPARADKGKVLLSQEIESFQSGSVRWNPK